MITEGNPWTGKMKWTGNGDDSDGNMVSGFFHDKKYKSIHWRPGWVHSSNMGAPGLYSLIPERSAVLLRSHSLNEVRRM